VSSSSAVSRARLPGRSKPPRGRVDAGGEIADSGVFQQLASRLGFLEQTRAKFDDPQRGLAPSDDGVDTGTVSVVRAHTAVSVAIEPGRVTAGPTITLARDQVGISLVADLDLDGRGQYVHSSLSPSRRQGRARSLVGNDNAGGASSGGFLEYRQHPRATQEGIVPELLAESKEFALSRCRSTLRTPDGVASAPPPILCRPCAAF
jgi:hypothetical protein